MRCARTHSITSGSETGGSGCFVCCATAFSTIATVTGTMSHSLVMPTDSNNAGTRAVGGCAPSPIRSNICCTLPATAAR